MNINLPGPLRHLFNPQAAPAPQNQQVPQPQNQNQQTPNPQGQQNQQNQGQQAIQNLNQAGGNLDANGNPIQNNGNNGGNQNSGNPEPDPIAALNDLINNPKTPKQEGGEPQDPFNLDPKRLRENIDKIDPFIGLDQQVLSDAMAGGNPEAMMKVIRHAVSAGLQHSVQISNNMARNSHKYTSDLLSSKIPNQVANQQGIEALIQANPAAAPMAKALIENLRAANPNASQETILKHATKAMADYQQSIIRMNQNSQNNNQGNDPNKQTQKQPESINWDEHFQDSEADGFRF